MAKGYSTDLRDRVVALVEAGESRREAARLLTLQPRRRSAGWIVAQTTGSVAAKPGTGHCRSQLEQHRQWLLDLVAAEPDLTLEEIAKRLRAVKKHKAGSAFDLALLRTSRHHLQKKLCTPPSRIVLT